MAGSPVKKARLEEINKQIDDLQHQLQKYKAALATHAPEVILGELPKPMTEYSDDLPDKIIAFGAIGYTLTMACAELGIPEEAIGEWRDRFPALEAAITRARVLGLAWVDQIQREAMMAGKFNFPHAQANAFRETLKTQGLSASEGGDGATLVRVVRGKAHQSA
jgi:hypothetical protein